MPKHFGGRGVFKRKGGSLRSEMQKTKYKVCPVKEKAITLKEEKTFCWIGEKGGA